MTSFTNLCILKKRTIKKESNESNFTKYYYELFPLNFKNVVLLLPCVWRVNTGLVSDPFYIFLNEQNINSLNIFSVNHSCFNNNKAKYISFLYKSFALTFIYIFFIIFNAQKFFNLFSLRLFHLMLFFIFL